MLSDLASLPAIAADRVAADAIARSESEHRRQMQVIRQLATDVAGYTIKGPIAYSSHRDATGWSTVVVHNFGPPLNGEAEVTVFAYRYRWTHKRFFDLADWLSTQLGVRRLLARIPPTDVENAAFAQRLGFRIVASDEDDERGTVNIWSIAPDDLFLYALRIKATR